MRSAEEKQRRRGKSSRVGRMHGACEMNGLLVSCPQRSYHKVWPVFVGNISFAWALSIEAALPGTCVAMGIIQDTTEEEIRELFGECLSSGRFECPERFQASSCRELQGATPTMCWALFG